ncbi:CaiB/BaiF CoA transferase family protein [Ottowia thiooxydans]|uniref:Crotonobetainyl-CoA:carnitine CoA-transferase CaiB-like acyl-CoA transferase n=1 Tax=Ottowia thiooxydans TaxID=219182 RepID=A0ABV2Q6L6_9BURK
MNESSSSVKKGPLDGMRVIDLTTVVLGPWAGQMLGDMGADVIKIETPQGDLTRQLGPRRNPGMAALHLTLNRNKRSVVLNLSASEGMEALFRLLTTADVFLCNMRPKVAAKLGLEPSIITERFPKLIHCVTYGFRKEGPLADKPAYDDVIQAACGLADLQGMTAGHPRYLPTVVADKTTAYNVVSSVLAALLHRERTGEGQAIEVPMFESMVDYVMIEHLYGAAFDPPIGEMGYARILTPERRPYATQDGYLAVLPYTDDNWRDILRLAGRQELMGDPRMATLDARVQHSSWVYALLAEIVATKTTAQWQTELDAANVPAMTVRSKEQLLQDPQLDASGFWHLMEHPTEGRVRVSDPPIRFSRSPSSVRRLAPRLGEHSREILLEAGYSSPEIDRLLELHVSQEPQVPAV